MRPEETKTAALHLWAVRLPRDIRYNIRMATGDVFRFCSKVDVRVEVWRKKLWQHLPIQQSNHVQSLIVMVELNLRANNLVKEYYNAIYTP